MKVYFIEYIEVKKCVIDIFKFFEFSEFKEVKGSGLMWVGGVGKESIWEVIFELGFIMSENFVGLRGI